MILAVDVGNTETHIGLFGENALVRDWRFVTKPIRTVDECAHAMADLLEQADAARTDLEGIVIGSVVPAATGSFAEVALRWVGKNPLIVGPDLVMPVKICTKVPEQVGADRIANAVAGCQWREPPLVVVDLGTATTFDVIARGARYLGGVIFPGVTTSLAELVRRTAKLTGIEICRPDRVIGTDTEECMQSGIVLGSADMIDGLLRRIWRELGEECPAIVTGGLGSSIAPLCSNVDEIDPHLTLKGLKILFDLNR